jgi:hypothetical protein
MARRVAPRGMWPLQQLQACYAVSLMALHDRKIEGEALSLAGASLLTLPENVRCEIGRASR